MYEALLHWIEEHLLDKLGPPPKGKAEHPQRAAAKVLGITQPVWNAILKHGRGVGVMALVDLRRSLGKPIDVLLGLDKTEPLARGGGHSNDVAPSSEVRSPGPRRAARRER